MPLGLPGKEPGMMLSRKGKNTSINMFSSSEVFFSLLIYLVDKHGPKVESNSGLLPRKDLDT